MLMVFSCGRVRGQMHRFMIECLCTIMKLQAEFRVRGWWFWQCWHGDLKLQWAGFSWDAWVTDSPQFNNAMGILRVNSNTLGGAFHKIELNHGMSHSTLVTNTLY